ncbi:type I-MYXAN CRISPR-associated protein Cas6/Cmx6 [candidate division WOR-3 bacterium]|nr:type I-MYXAN CRISPR-associated protein Cas6/Cmx6 [candidate division WOR-3 bacterium]
MQMPFVDVSFKLQGSSIPVDHGYLLYSTVSKHIPEIHGNEEVGLHPVTGQLAGNRLLSITDRSSLIFRLSSDRISQILPIAGKELNIGEYKIRIGVPQTRALVPSARLYSRLVVIKGFMEPKPFLEAVQRQLDALNIKGKPSLVEQPHIADANENKDVGTHSPVLRRTIRIRDKDIVGFAVRVEELTAEESLRLQEKGLGGRRRFGCGIFIPDRR